MVTARNGRKWVANRRWSDEWRVIEQLQEGGQGYAYRARRKSDGRVAFVKSIKARDVMERRARFFREATAYDTCGVAGIPKLVESNAHRHAEADFEVYLATDFVEGPTLRVWRNERDSLGVDSAVQIVRGVVAILRDCHLAGWIHRDVKPDNIVLAGGDPAQPVLLDFGLCFADLDENGFTTEDEQEVGNRFLRLPELSAGSLAKQDPRSDVTFGVGILFYLLTGNQPNVLQDADGRLPHQREDQARILAAACGDRWRRLVALFDSAFAPMLADRVSSAEALLTKLDEVVEGRGVGRSREANLQAILEVVESAAERRRIQTVERLTNALRRVHDVHEALRRRFDGGLGLGQTGWSVDGRFGRCKLYWQRRGRHERISVSECEVSEVGDEIVIRISGDTVYRTPIVSPRYGDEFRTVVEEWVLADLREGLARDTADAGRGSQ